MTRCWCALPVERQKVFSNKFVAAFALHMNRATTFPIGTVEPLTSGGTALCVEAIEREHASMIKANRYDPIAIGIELPRNSLKAN